MENAFFYRKSYFRSRDMQIFLAFSFPYFTLLAIDKINRETDCR